MKYFSASVLTGLALCLATLGTASTDQKNTYSADEVVVIQIVSKADTVSAVPFEAIFETEEEVLIEEEGTTPMTYELAESKFSGTVRPTDNALIEVTATRGSLSSGRSSTKPTRVVVTRDRIALSPVR